MKGIIKIETSKSFYEGLKKESLGIEVKEDDKEYQETEVHFSKDRLGEFYKYEDIIVTIIGGKRYDLRYNDKLYEKMCAIYE